MREHRADMKCSACGSALKIDERASAKRARLIYLCKGCGKPYSWEGRDRQPAEERTLTDAASRTMRMRVVAPDPTSAPLSPELQALPDGMTLALEVTAGPERGRVYHLDRRATVIGREEGEVRIHDPMISRRHACLEIHDIDTIILRDLSSTNGTYHNDRLIAFCKVQDGDEIRMGSTTLTVSMDVLG